MSLALVNIWNHQIALLSIGRSIYMSLLVCRDENQLTTPAAKCPATARAVGNMAAESRVPNGEPHGMSQLVRGNCQTVVLIMCRGTEGPVPFDGRTPWVGSRL